VNNRTLAQFIVVGSDWETNMSIARTITSNFGIGATLMLCAFALPLSVATASEPNKQCKSRCLTDDGMLKALSEGFFSACMKASQEQILTSEKHKSAGRCIEAHRETIGTRERRTNACIMEC
jgi:hypothetical protein